MSEVFVSEDAGDAGAGNAAAGGLTRADWAAEADRWLATARRHAVAGGALIRPPGPVSQSGPLSDGIEGFARCFLVAAARLAGWSEPVDGDPAPLAGFWIRGLTAAMDPASPAAWPRAVGAAGYPHAGITQPAVEAANLAFGLALCPTRVWDLLPDATRERLADWLAHHARLRVWDHNNWLLFPAMCEAFLASAGIEVTGGHGAGNVERVESWYLGEGWYNDGPPAAPGRNLDHYNSWVFQPFLWQWYRLRGAAEPSWRAERFRTRLAEFAAGYADLFATDGAPLILGRSLVYRHAVLGGLWTAGLALDHPPADAIRRVADRTLRHFRGLGVDGARPPSLGWRAAEFLPAAQEYSGSGSPYFAGMGFLGLAAPPGHAVWSADAGPSPAATPPAAAPRDTVRIRPALGWAVQRIADGRLVRVINHGTDHATHPDDPGDPHYAKFAYSTHTAPGTATAWSDRAWPAAADSHLSLLDPWGRPTRRGRIMATTTGPDYAASWHLPRLAPSGTPLPGAKVVTASLLHARFEVRCHLVTAPPGWSLHEGGQSLSRDGVPPSSGTTPSTAWTATDHLHSRVTALFGYESAGTEARHGTDMLGEHSVTPYLVGTRPSPQTPSVHVALHVLEPAEPDGGFAGFTGDGESGIEVLVEGTTVTVVWPDARRSVLDLDALFQAE